MPVFDKLAQTYDRWYESRMGSFADKVETDLAFRFFKVEKGMHILDAGCGTGNFSLKLARKGLSVTGVDISDPMLAIARRKAAEQNFDIIFHNMDLYKLDFPDNHFDGVFSMAAFEFIEEPLRALDELFRVVKPGGQVLVGTISRDSSWGALYLTDEFRTGTVFRHACFKTLDEMKQWNAEKLIAAGDCLFVPPLSKEEDFNMKKEQELSGSVKGGYICALWKK